MAKKAAAARRDDDEKARVQPPGLPELVTPYIGVDEAGRGALAGPVVAAAVLIPAGFDFGTLPGLTDSKAMTAADRARVGGLLRDSGLVWGVGLAEAAEVDRVNVLCATFRAFARALLDLRVKLNPPGESAALCRVYVDGNQTLPGPQWETVLRERGLGALPLPEQVALVRGDALAPGISAASVLAKTVRDGLMEDLETSCPGYGFAKHKGYGASAHLERIRVLGPSPAHRLTFKGVRREEKQLDLLRMSKWE